MPFFLSGITYPYVLGSLDFLSVNQTLQYIRGVSEYYLLLPLITFN